MLDNPKAILEQDKLGVIQATRLLPKQCQQVWDETRDLEIPAEYSDINRVVVAGMGGSHLGAQLIQAVYASELKQPIIIQNEYTPPAYVDANTLVLATSFSGNTEEILEFTNKSLKVGAKVIVISAGGKLEQLATDNQLPHYVFESTHNPSRIPRYGSGYLFTAQLAILSKVGVINFDDNHLAAIVEVLEQSAKRFDIEIDSSDNLAKKLAEQIQDRTVLLVASEHLYGSAYIFKNQINESAKQLAALFAIPELNHHLLEGLAHPKSNPDNLSFVFFDSNLYHPRNQARYGITQEVIDKQDIDTHVFKPLAETRLLQAFEVLSFTSFTALYISILNQVDPGPNPWVDYLKAELAKL